MGGGGVMRAAAKVAGVGVVNTTFRSSFQVAPPSAEHSIMRVASRPASSAMVASSGVADGAVSANPKGSWEMIDDWEFAGAVEDDVALVGSNSVSSGGERMARVIFGGVPTKEEAKEATADLKDALDKVYLSSPNSTETVEESCRTLPSCSEETKDCVACDHIKVTSVPQPAIQAFRLLNENSSVQCVVASLAADPNVWNAVLNNGAYMDFVQSQKTYEKYEDHGSPRSSVSSVKLEEFSDESQPKDLGNRFSDFLENVKTTVVEMVNKATGFLQSLFTFPTGENAKENAGSTSNFDKTFGASIMGLAVMAIMVVILKRN